MSSSSRRKFLALTGAGVSAAVVAPAVAASTRTAARSAPGADGAPVVAYVRDASAGELVVMMGERQVLVHDVDLVRRLARHLP